VFDPFIFPEATAGRAMSVPTAVVLPVKVIASWLVASITMHSDGGGSTIAQPGHDGLAIRIERRNHGMTEDGSLQ